MPTLDTLRAVDDARAWVLAAERLSSSQHYNAIEVWDDDRLVGRMERGANAV